MADSSSRKRWGLAIGSFIAVIAAAVWFVWSDNSWYRLLVRMYQDEIFLKKTMDDLGLLAPVVFILIQALQVVISPIPGEATGFLGGFLFGEWLGLIYSTIGLTLGSALAFTAGRWLGAHFVQKLVSKETWDRLGFIVEAEGAIICFIMFLIPGLPKDMVCYLFGMSPMPLWVFTVVSGLGRVPGTWVLSAQGARTATGSYVQLVLLTAIALAVALPLFYYRHRIVAWFHGRSAERGPEGDPRP